MNVIDYLNYYKGYSFDEYPFNDMDNILFASLIYINFKELDSSKKVSILDIDVKYKDHYAYDCFCLIKNSIRYKDLYFSNYVNISNSTTQFGALSIRYKKKLYVVYKGTDNSTIGWKENFELLYKNETKAQGCAVKYLNDVTTHRDKEIYLIGHSKGGNLAMYAYLYSNNYIKRKVKKIYNNDGPGFKNDIYNSSFYKDMESKLKMFIPECSIVGTLLNMPIKYNVIKSDSKGFKAHDMSTWQCFGTIMIKGSITKESFKLNEDVIKMLNKYNSNEIREMVESFFKILEDNNIKTTDDFSKLKLNKKKDMLLNVKNMKSDARKIFIKLAKNFFINIRR